MKFCADHWEKLRQAIRDRGLDALVSEGGEAAARHLVSEMQEGRTVDNFDPLMGAHNAIISNAMTVARDAAGPSGVFELMDDANAGGGCPICFLNCKHDEACTEVGCTFSYDHWIGRAADDMVAAWQAIGVGD